MRDSLTRGATAAAFVAAFLLAAPAGAQQQQQPMTPQGAQPSAEFTEAQLDAFAAAAEDVLRLQQEYDAKLQGASNDQEAEALRGEAMEAAIGALDDHGITPEEYNSIVAAAQADPTLHAAIIERMDTAE